MRQPRTHRRNIALDGQGRRYLAYLPQAPDPTSARPVLVVLHGGGGSAAFAHRVHGWTELADRCGCLVLFPEATCEDPARPACVRTNPRIWNDGGRRSEVAQRNVDDIGYLNAVLDDASGVFPADARRVFMTGFSNGATMTFRAGIELSHRLAAIAPVSGHLCVPDPQPARPLSMLFISGLADPINPFHGGTNVNPWGHRRHRPPMMDSIRAWLRLIAAPDQPTERDHQEGVTRVRYGPGQSGREVRLITIEGQGHEWPGARRTLPASISGPQTDKLDATETIWEFFTTTSTP